MEIMNKQEIIEKIAPIIARSMTGLKVDLASGGPSNEQVQVFLSHFEGVRLENEIADAILNAS